MKQYRAESVDQLFIWMIRTFILRTPMKVLGVIKAARSSEDLYKKDNVKLQFILDGKMILYQMLLKLRLMLLRSPVFVSPIVGYLLHIWRIR